MWIIGLFIVFLSACGNVSPSVGLPLRHKWDLSEPAYVAIEEHYTRDGQPTFPAPELYRQAFQRAISQAGGVITQDRDAAGEQVLTLFDTDGSKCSGKTVFAFSEPDTKRTAICHSIAVLNGNYNGDLTFLTTLALHELGHHFGHKGWHIGGDDVPADDCRYSYIMAWNLRCYHGSGRYVGLDRDYVCDNQGWMVGGVCAMPVAPLDHASPTAVN